MPKKRPKSNKTVPRVLHIFCEGEKTEPIYLNGFIRKYHSGKRHIIVVEDTNKNTPIQLVEVAIAHRKANGLQEDEYWVVFDRESTTKYTHDNHLKAKDNADRNNINIAFSNVCIEVWLLAHFSNSCAAYSCHDDLRRRSPLLNNLKSVGINNYDKANYDLFEKLAPRLQNAITNAKQINNTAKAAAQHGRTAPCFLNPYTNMYDLLEAINNFR
jgi:hypothetical protein